MKTVCLYFQVHQPWRLKKYRFFNMGKDHNYLDDLTNRAIMQKVARQCYLPMNALLMKLIKEYGGRFRCSFSITGIAVEQMRAYAPELLESFKELAATGCVEFLAETYSHSLASLASKEDFVAQVNLHAELMKREFGVKPTAFRNTELIYSDDIGATVAEMGFRTMLAEGAKHILGWKSPNYVYANAVNQKLRLLLRNYKLSDDIAFRFSNRAWDQWPLTAGKYVDWIASEETPGEVVNLFMDYETFGEHQSADTGIFEFMRALPKEVLDRKGELEFATVSETAKSHQPVSVLHCPHVMSWADEERDVTAWLGNELQNEAFEKLYALKQKVAALKNPDFDYVWSFMQTSDHFYYMATKWLSDGDVHSYFNPYDSAYEAFINYMNVLSDFALELDRAVAGMVAGGGGSEEEMAGADKAGEKVRRSGEKGAGKVAEEAEKQSRALAKTEKKASKAEMKASETAQKRLRKDAKAEEKAGREGRDELSAQVGRESAAAVKAERKAAETLAKAKRKVAEAVGKLR